MLKNVSERIVLLRKTLTSDSLMPLTLKREQYILLPLVIVNLITLVPHEKNWFLQCLASRDPRVKQMFPGDLKIRH